MILTMMMLLTLPLLKISILMMIPLVTNREICILINGQKRQDLGFFLAKSPKNSDFRT